MFIQDGGKSAGRVKVVLAVIAAFHTFLVGKVCLVEHSQLLVDVLDSDL